MLEKEDLGKYAIIVLIFAGLMGILLVFKGGLTGYAIFNDATESDFLLGIFNNTFYNSSGFIQLNETIAGNTTIIQSNVSEMSGAEQGLISYWRFNESSWNGVNGEVKDVLGKNNGTAKSGANTTIGLFGRAGSFDGTSGVAVNEVQIVNKEELNPIQNSFTITGWAKSSQKGGANQWHLYVAKRTTSALNGYYVGMLEGSGLNFMVGDGTNRYDTRDTNYVPIVYDTWFYFAAVINRTSNQILLYVNGTLKASRSFTTLNNINNSWNLTIGNDEGQAIAGYQYPVKGQIDEVAIWNRALNSSEILALYNKGLSNSTNSTTNSTYFYNGTYESVVKDAGSIVSWGNISWNGLESSDGGITTEQGNILLMFLEGNANDENGINNGILRNNPASIQGKNNLGYYLDGTDDYIEITDSSSLDLSSSFSLGAWVNFSSIVPAGQWQGIITKGAAGDSPADVNHNFFLSFDNNMGWGSGVGITWGYEDSSGNNYQTRYQWIPDIGKWYHIAGVFNDSADTMTLYINGTQVSQFASATATPVTNTHPVFIGRNLNGSSTVYYLNAVVDDVFISNKSLSAEEIQQIYTSSVSSSSNLKFQLRTSNDNLTWTEYKGSDGTSSGYYTSPSSLNLSDSKYLQYKAFFTRESLSENPKLYNVSIDYSSSGSDVSVSLDSPADNYLANQYNGINITCSASSTSELSNITAYYNKFGWGQAEPARQISGTSNTTTFTLNEIASTILWNCYVCNVNGICSFASSNKTIIGDILPPEINLISPTGDYVENSTSTISFVFNATDNRATSLNCNLLIDEVESATNSSVLVGVNTNLSSTLANGNHTWKINCSDGINSALSEERKINLSYSASYTTFWAKTNTHTHTTNSDGDSSPTAVINLYKGNGYSIVAITDHGYVTNCTPFTNLSEPFLCVNSEEWTSTKHMTRINVSVPYNNNAANLQNAVNAAVNEGGFAIVAHPNWSSTIWSVSDLTSLQNYTAMEIYNKVIERLSPDPYAVAKWDSVLLTGKKIFGVAADDMHQVNVDLGYGFTKVYMPEFTKQAYINSMNTGYFYSSQGPNMDAEPFTLDCDGAESYNMGQIANCSVISVNATISATNSSFIMKNITLVKDGSVLNITICSTQNCSFSYSENVSSSGYYRLEATDSNNKRVWSNPIWVTKIALPVIITVHSPINNLDTDDYTPLINVSLNQQTSLWMSINNGSNVTLCAGCSSYNGYGLLREGLNTLIVYANNSDNIVKENKVYVTLDFNKTIFDDFIDNSSVASTLNVSWNSGKMSLGAGNIFGNFIFKPILTINNITGFTVEWTENNTENAKGEGQRTPIILKYKIGSSDWINQDSEGDYIINGTTISGLNGNNLSLMLDFEKNPSVPVDLLDFRITWKEFTIPLIFNVSSGTPTTTSATITWDTDLTSNSSVFYGISTSLGQSVSLNDGVTSHSLTINGLSSSTSYFYKVQSCTESSCAQDPQTGLYSFTTQSASVPPTNLPGGGGGGGGGGSITNATKLGKLSVSLIGDIIAREGDKKTLSLNVKNIGRIFLNNCRLIAKGDISSWIYSTTIKGIAPGENLDFVFDLNVPEETAPEINRGSLEVKCEEASDIQNISVSIPKELGLIEIKDIKQEGNILKINYVFNSSKFVGDSIDIEIWLADKNETELKRMVDKSPINKEGLINRNVEMQLPGGLGGGVYFLYFAFSIDASNFIKKPVVLGVTGRAILDSEKGKFGIYILFLLIIGIAIFFIWRRHGREKRSEHLWLLRKRAESKSSHKQFQ